MSNEEELKDLNKRVAYLEGRIEEMSKYLLSVSAQAMKLLERIEGPDGRNKPAS